MKEVARGSARCLCPVPYAKDYAVYIHNTPQMRIGVRGRGFDAGGGKEGAGKEIGEIQTGSRQTESRQTGSRQTGSRQTGSRQTGSRHTGSRHTGSRQTGSRHTGPRQTGSRQTGPDRPVQTAQFRPTRWGRSGANRAPPAWDAISSMKMSAALHENASQK